MRIKDIPQLRGAISELRFEKDENELWEIHFTFGAGEDASEHCVTRHYPGTCRTWKNLDSVYKASIEIFGENIKEIKIITKRSN